MKQVVTICVLITLICAIVLYNVSYNVSSSSRESFSNAEDQYLNKQGEYYKGRLDGPSSPSMRDADEFYTFDSDKKAGSQLVLTNPDTPQQTNDVDTNVQRCKQVTSCDELDTTNCGYCFTNNRFYYGDKSGPFTDVCPGGWVKTKEACQERRERAVCAKVTNCHEMIGPAAICGWCEASNKAMPSQLVDGKLVPKYPSNDKCDDSGFGLVAQSDCTKFNQEHPCIGPNENTGPHSVKCLQKLWKQSGCSAKGTIGPSQPKNNNAHWNQQSWQSVLDDMKAWYNDATGSNWDSAKQHHEGCLGTQPDPCDSKYSPRPLECAQKLFLASGCSEKGKLYPNIDNVAKYGPDYYATEEWKAGIKTWGANTLTEKLTGLVQDSQSSEYSVKARATELCFGTQVAAPPALKPGDEVKYLFNYPVWGTEKSSIRGYIGSINDGKAKIFWEEASSADGKQTATRGAHESDDSIRTEWFGGAAGTIGSRLKSYVPNEIPVTNLTLLSSCKANSSCPDAGCSMQMILSVSYAPNHTYNVPKTQVRDVVSKVTTKYPGAVLCQMSDIQYLVNTGVPYCFCGWVEHNGTITSVYPSSSTSSSGCGGGQVKVISCGNAGPSWTGGKATVYIRVTGDPATILSTLQTNGLAADVLAVVGKNDYVSLL